MNYKNKITVVVPLGLRRESVIIDSLKKNKVSYYIELGQNPSANRNRGAAKAKTALVGFTNAHSILANNWAEEVIRFFTAYPNIDIVGGPQLTTEEESFFAKTSGYALSSMFGTANLRDRYRPRTLKLNATEKEITLANLVCKLSVVRKIHFDESLYPGEDVKFLHDAEKAKLNIAYSPDIQVYNKRRPQASGFYGLIKQMFNYGRVRPQVEGLQTLAKKPLFIIPSLFLLYLLLLPTLYSIKSFFLAPVVLYAIITIVFSFYESFKNKHLSAFILLLFIFPIIHIVYGAGFLYGLITKTTALRETTKLIDENDSTQSHNAIKEKILRFKKR